MRALLLLFFFLLSFAASAAVGEEKATVEAVASLTPGNDGGKLTITKPMENTLIPGLTQVGPTVGTAKSPLSGPIPVVAEERRFENQRIRIVAIDGTTQFVAMDVAATLGYSSPRQAVRAHVSRCNRDAVCLTDAIGRRQTFVTINEAGLYELTLNSKKPAAREFKKWVTSEVLPSVRKTGSYELKGRAPALLEVARSLRGRGAAKKRQINKVVSHRTGDFSIRVGRRWIRHIPTLVGCDLPRSHSLREGLALGAFSSGQTAGLPIQ